MRNKVWASCLLILLGSLTFAQEQGGVDEKAGQRFVNMNLVQSLTAGRAGTVTGSLVGAPTYDRIFTGDVDPNCAATSTFSGIGTGVPYAVIPVYSSTGENVVASLVNAGTTLTDTVLSLYCDPFDPANADQNLVAYNDDASGLISAFDGTEGAFMTANTQYFLVVSVFGPASVGGGDFELTLGGDIFEGAPRVVPTLGTWGLIFFVALLAIAGMFFMRRQRMQGSAA